jgi:hypothetical protein
MEITAELSSKRRCIVITAVGEGKTATFKTSEPAATLWARNSPCPAWAREAVRAWSRTPAALALYQQLAMLLGRDPEDLAEVPTSVDRKRD